MNVGENEPVLVRVTNEGSRIRRKKVSSREISKKARHSILSGSSSFITCRHNNKAFQCSSIRPVNALDFRKKLYASCDKVLQDQMSDLSVRKLRDMYNNSVSAPELKVSKTMFRKIFCGEFNIGFKSPASDICGYCAMIDNKIKTAGVNEKATLFTEKRIHRIKAKAFYDIIRETHENEVTLCFDMQQVQPLPRTPIQQAFYKRQLSVYNVCITDVTTTKPVFFYLD
ncbi:hypothetical protein JTE90_005572 [Oedothorax gibbosus]|uniref:Uncharacterized protein n=1 Tax=Oedothorax gibbosus TaxID=931172 RepID=A0AAV6V937_9ARAC|nr:hypothetical protein JTE90_005572 [Oedothorax gibbosus]